MKKKKNVEFWNFVCHFGQGKMLDYFLDFIYPALTTERVRCYGDSRWFFYDVRLVEPEINGQTLPFIYGRLVKDTVLERDQVFEDNQLKIDPLRVQNSPSSIFILSLLDHRLFFIKEQKDSPTMDSFKSTILKFIKDVRNERINDDYNYMKELRELNEGSTKVTSKKNLAIQFPEPELEIIPLSSDADMDEFIKGMRSIDRFSLDLIMPNSEFDSNAFFSSWREETNKIGTKKSKINFPKNGKSLPHANVSELAKEAIKDENIMITLVGKDLDNDKIIGTNDSFKLTRSLDEIDQVPLFTVKKIYETFLGLIDDGVIRGPKICDLEKVKEKIKHIVMMIK
ncbi:hypothetical protein [Vibrio cholerae]|uniref:hypothetical protein n=1 Tax=Vibrio cholerae TaxID=666 RepID=UPI00103427DE|nr:hypothetical protein [Vibrio cholerae]TBN26302.1 hypothetical protein EYC50_08520 [Vibrio cholerae]HDG1717173.1 hypothetical protein [Vibrio cholerae]